MREARFLPQDVYVDAIKCHSDVVRPPASGVQVALDVNPYHLGFHLWEHIIAEHGVEAARRVMQQDDDFAFVRGQLTRELAAELGLFRYKGAPKGPYVVEDDDIGALQEALLAPKYGFGAPTVLAQHVRVDGTLELVQDHVSDGRGLDAERASRVLDYLVKVWRRPIRLATVNGDGGAFEITATPP
jgi:stage V sporulation protein R